MATYDNMTIFFGHTQMSLHLWTNAHFSVNTFGKCHRKAILRVKSTLSVYFVDQRSVVYVVFLKKLLWQNHIYVVVKHKKDSFSYLTLCLGGAPFTYRIANTYRNEMKNGHSPQIHLTHQKSFIFWFLGVLCTFYDSYVYNSCYESSLKGKNRKRYRNWLNFMSFICDYSFCQPTSLIPLTSYRISYLFSKILIRPLSPLPSCAQSLKVQETFVHKSQSNISISQVR